MPLSQVTITGTWPVSNGVQATGQVIIAPFTEYTGGGVILAAVPVIVPLVNGAISVNVYNNAQITGLQYQVTEQITGAPSVTYVITPAGSTMDLSSAPRGSGPTVIPLYLLAGSLGQVGGPAGPLDGAGHIPAAQIPSSASGVQTIAATNGTIVVTGGTSANPTIAVGAGIPEGSVTNLVADLAARLVAANNLSDVASATTARTNLGLGTAAVANVGTGAGTVAAGNDSRLSLRPYAPVALTDAATITVDATQGQVFTVTLGGNRTLGNPTGALDGQRLLFRITQPASGGPYALTLGTAYNLGGQAASWSTGANKTDYLGCIYNAATSKFDVIAPPPGLGGF